MPPSDDEDEAGAAERCTQPAGEDTGGQEAKGGVLAVTQIQTARDVKVCDSEDEGEEEEEEEEEPWGPEVRLARRSQTRPSHVVTCCTC